MSREARRQKLLELADRIGLGAVLLRAPANFGWYTGGADSRVDHSNPAGVAAVLVTPDAEYVVADNIEAARMRGEEIPGMEVVEHPWYEAPAKLLRHLTDGGSLGADAPVEGAADVSGEVAPLRFVLDCGAIERYREVEADAEAAIFEVVSSLNPGANKWEAAAGLVAAGRRRGMFAPVVLATSARRLGHYRHPIPHGDSLGGRAMLVVCAERGGLYANLTRMLDVEVPDRETRWRQAACNEVLRRMRDEGTHPDRSLADAFEDCKWFYAESGYLDGWKDHQGGLSCYASREVIATPGTDLAIRPGWPSPGTPRPSGPRPRRPSCSRGRGRR